MIKLNLLPGYVHEKGKIRTSIIVFLVIVCIEVGVIFWAKQGYEAQTSWFTKDKQYYTDRVTEINDGIKGTDQFTAPSTAYDELVPFFKRESCTAYTEKLLKVMSDVPNKLKNVDGWYDDLTIKDDELTMPGHLKGIMNFVSFYFDMKDKGFTIAPSDETIPKPFPAKPNTQEMRFTLTVKLDDKIPAKVAPPKDAVPWPSLYKAHGAAAAPAEGAPGVPGGGPAAAPGVPNGAPGVPKGPGGGPGVAAPAPMPAPVPPAPVPPVKGK